MAFENYNDIQIGDTVHDAVADWVFKPVNTPYPRSRWRSPPRTAPTR